MSLIDWLRLSLAEGIGPILQSRLVEACGGDVAQAANASVATLRQIEGIGSAKAQQIHAALQRAAREADEELNKAHGSAVGLICRGDPDYPALLKEIPDPPAVLYMKGDLQPRDLIAVAIVGSRKCSIYGREQAERFGALLAGSGITVLSGGARGVDSSAHRGAIAHANGRTIAVLGCGVDMVYPPENEKLFEQIADGHGAIVSEYALGTPPMAENFPRRNRIVSGMSRGVLVIEADERSGALITARQAGEDHGRVVFALPGRVDNKLSIGPHKLIRDGAVLVTSLEDVLDGLGPLPESAIVREEAKPQAKPAAPLQVEVTLFTDSQRTILDRMDHEPVDVDSLIERTALPANIVLQELTLLTLRGAVKRVEGQTYVRRGDAR